MKLDFLLKQKFVNKGVYNNKNVIENTLPAFDLAIKGNFGICFRVRCTKDNKVIVYDDENFARLLKVKDSVESVNYDDIAYLSSYHVPLLEEVLNFINDKTPVIINLASVYDKKMTKEILTILDKYHGRFAIVSNNSKTISYFNKVRENYILGEIVSKQKPSIYSLGNFIAHYMIKTDFKSVNIKHYNSSELLNFKKLEVPLIGYLITDQRQLNSYNDYFDNIVVDGNIFNI